MQAGTTFFVPTPYVFELSAWIQKNFALSLNLMASKCHEIWNDIVAYGKIHACFKTTRGEFNIFTLNRMSIASTNYRYIMVRPTCQFWKIVCLPVILDLFFSIGSDFIDAFTNLFEIWIRHLIMRQNEKRQDALINRRHCETRCFLFVGANNYN